MNGVGLQAPAQLELGYTDYAALQRQYSNAENTPDNIAKAARQFESIFIDMWLKSARDANKVLAEDNFLSGQYMDMSQQMLDHEMSVHLAGQGGIGLAEVIVRQLSGKLNLQPGTTPVVAETATSGRSESPVNEQTGPFESPQRFVESILPIVQHALKGVALPAAAVLGQAALETGWGAHVISHTDGTSTHNLFGIKAHRDDPHQVAVVTREFEHGRWLDKEQAFRSYDSWASSVRDYVQKITGESRYADALNAGQKPESYLAALQQAGYATDPNYAAKIMRVVERVQQMLPGAF